MTSMNLNNKNQETKTIKRLKLKFESGQRTSSDGAKRQIVPMVDGARKKWKFTTVQANEWILWGYMDDHGWQSSDGEKRMKCSRNE